MRYRQVNCPDNFISDSLNINGTLFLICRPVSEWDESNDNLMIGLILGLGLPIFLILLLLLWAYNRVRQKISSTSTSGDKEKILAEEIQRRNYDFQRREEV